jgi:hypothetical protein
MTLTTSARIAWAPATIHALVADRPTLAASLNG